MSILSTRSIKLDATSGKNESVTAQGGLAHADRLAQRLGLWDRLHGAMPARLGYDWVVIIKSIVMGLLTAAAGTHAAQALRQDKALQRLLGLDKSGVPEEATIWRAMQRLGECLLLNTFQMFVTDTASRLIARIPRWRLTKSTYGFFPLFIDGTVLEGSLRRKGAKWFKKKEPGMLWVSAFVGSIPVAERLAKSGKGEGELTLGGTLLERVLERVLKPNNLVKDTLVLCDSLFGKGPFLKRLEAAGLLYVVGANGLTEANRVLSEQPECAWHPTPSWNSNAWNAGVCLAWIECAEWEGKRLIVGRRWMKPGELFWNYRAVVTNLTADERRVQQMMKRLKISFAEAVWRFYDSKGGCENYFKKLLSGLGLHHPPSQYWVVNAGFYAVGLLAGLLTECVGLIATPRNKPVPTLETLRRWLFEIPCQVTRHAGEVTVTILGLSDQWRAEIAEGFDRLATC